MKTLDLGTISHGTLRACDLACAIVDALRAMEDDDSDLLADLDRVASGDAADDADDIVGDGIYALQAYAPPFCYVGMHEGDGSDLGVWFSHDAFEDACREGDVLQIGDSSDLDDMSPQDVVTYEYVAVVSDHGNMTLYRPRVTLGEEVLSLV